MRDILAPAADWTGQTWAARIDQCAGMLFCHGYIPMSVRDKITRRITKECEAAIAMEARQGRDGEARLDPKDDSGSEGHRPSHPPQPKELTMEKLEELADRLDEFDRRYSSLMRNGAGLSPEGIGIALLTTIYMPDVANAAAALRTRSAEEK